MTTTIKHLVFIDPTIEVKGEDMLHQVAAAISLLAFASPPTADKVIYFRNFDLAHNMISGDVGISFDAHTEVEPSDVDFTFFLTKDLSIVEKYPRSFAGLDGEINVADGVRDHLMALRQSMYPNGIDKDVVSILEKSITEIDFSKFSGSGLSKEGLLNALKHITEFHSSDTSEKKNRSPKKQKPNISPSNSVMNNNASFSDVQVGEGGPGFPPGYEENFDFIPQASDLRKKMDREQATNDALIRKIAARLKSNASERVIYIDDLIPSGHDIHSPILKPFTEKGYEIRMSSGKMYIAF